MNEQTNTFLYGGPLYQGFGKFVEESFEGVIPLRRGGCSKHFAQASASPDAHDLLYPRSRGGTKARPLSTSGDHVFSQFLIHNSESCRLSSADSGTSSTSICPVLSAAAN